jgi:hypothetical protein
MPRITGREGVTMRLKGMVSEDAVRKVGAALFAGGEENLKDGRAPVHGPSHGSEA